MAVFKRPGYDKYYFKFTFNGKQYYKNAQTTDEKVAIRREDRFRAELERDAALPEDERPLPPPPTFGEYARVPVTPADSGGRFWAEHATAAYASEPNTYKFYLGRVRALLKFEKLALAPLNQIGDGLVQDLLTYFKGLKLKNGGINRNMSALRVVLSRAVNEKLIRESLVFKARKEKSPGRPISDHEETVYLSRVTDLDHRDFFSILIDTAIEPGVAACLKWGDIWLDPVDEFPRGYIHALGTKNEVRERDVPLTARLNLLLRERRMRAGMPGDDSYVFPADRLGRTHPTPVETFRSTHDKLWESVGGRAPLPIKKFRLYDLRHTCLTRLVENGADAFALQAIAGWKSTRMASVYIKLGHRTRIAAIEGLNTRLERRAAKS